MWCYSKINKTKNWKMSSMFLLWLVTWFCKFIVFCDDELNLPSSR